FALQGVLEILTIRINCVNLREARGERAPFPCWSLQEEGNCQALQSVVDLFIDDQEILWVLDVGVVHTLSQPIKRCAPKVVAISLHSRKVVKVIDLSNVITQVSRLQHLLVDYDNNGRAYVYIADAGSRAILVHDVTENKSYRIVLPVAVKDGPHNDVLYMVLIRKPNGTNVVYFTYLGSPRLFSIKTEHLRRGRGSGSVVDVGPKPNGQPIVLLGTDNGSSLFLRYKGLSDIYLWNTETCFKSSNFLEVQKGAECRLATQVMPGQKRYMWTIESNFHHYIADTVGCTGASVVIHPVVRESED
ncbi:Major royal jelly protein 1, partial [Pseudolycoriella hygida]